MSVDKVLDSLPGRDAAAIDRLVQWLRIPSVSTDPAYRDDVRAAAQWCAEELRKAGLSVELHETGTPDNPGHPVVWAQTPDHSDTNAPHVLFYGHYDVQPPEPLELWNSPPFEPAIVPADDGPDGQVPGERVVARGAVDDKGQVATFIEALQAWRESAGDLPIKLSVLIEGEEESGSANLERYIDERRDVLSKADICVISDTGMLKRGVPAITLGVRGLAYTEVILHGPNQDLHSGMWGGRCPNPINELTKVLAQLWDSERRITIPGFYDDVLEITEQDSKLWNTHLDNQLAALKKIGLGPDADVGEQGFNAIEREWCRPTCDINGIWGGYQGAGAKTVIPAFAGAKVSFRLVANQDPHAITESFRTWLDDHTPPGCRWEFHDHSGGHAGNVSTESPFLQAATRALESASGTKPHLIKTGGSIPVVGMLKGMLGLDTLLIGFGLDDDRVHSPNEKFELSCFRLGVRSHVHLIDELARLPQAAAAT